MPLGSYGFNQTSFNSNVAAYASGLGHPGQAGMCRLPPKRPMESVPSRLSFIGISAGAWQDSQHDLHLFRRRDWPGDAERQRLRRQSSHSLSECP